jgi:hypothetical protein
MDTLSHPGQRSAAGPQPTLLKGSPRGLNAPATPARIRFAGPMTRFSCVAVRPAKAWTPAGPALKTVDNAPSSGSGLGDMGNAFLKDNGSYSLLMAEEVVMPAEAGIQKIPGNNWIPAFAGMTVGLKRLFGAFGVLPKRFHLFESCLFGGAALGVKSGFYQLETAHKFRIRPT